MDAVRLTLPAMQLLNKDNFYYKKLNRELKRKLRVELGESTTSGIFQPSSLAVPETQAALGHRPADEWKTDHPSHLRQGSIPSASEYLTPVDDGSQRAPLSHCGGLVGAGPPPSGEDAGGESPAEDGQEEKDHGKRNQDQDEEGGGLSGSRRRLMAELSNYKSRMRASSSSGSPSRATLRSRPIVFGSQGRIASDTHPVDDAATAGSRSRNSRS